MISDLCLLKYSLGEILKRQAIAEMAAVAFSWLWMPGRVMAALISSGSSKG